MKEGLVGGQDFAIDASLISADVQKQNSSNPEDWEAREIDTIDAPRAVREYLDTLDNEAFGAATTAKPKVTAHADLTSQWTAARKGPAFFAYSDNCLIDKDHGVIMDVDASRSNKTAEVGAVRKMLDRTEERFGVKPDWIAADIAYGFVRQSGLANAEAPDPSLHPGLRQGRTNRRNLLAIRLRVG